MLYSENEELKLAPYKFSRKELVEFALYKVATKLFKNNDRMTTLVTGLYRRSAMMLDSAGCPVWFVKRWCRTPKNWGTMLTNLAKSMHLIDYDDVDE